MAIRNGLEFGFRISIHKFAVVAVKMHSIFAPHNELISVITTPFLTSFPARVFYVTCRPPHVFASRPCCFI